MSQRNKMSFGEDAEIVTRGECGRALKIGELFDENGEPIDSTPHPYMRFYMKVPFEVKEGDILRAI